MKKIYSIFVFLLLLFIFPTLKAQQKTDVLADISAEVNQDSLTSYILSLQNFGTRYALADNRKEVAMWIKQKFESFGYQDVILDSFLLDYNNYNLMQYNVICRSDSIYDHDDYVLIGAHHDAVTYNSPMDSTPGADDNASGVAGVLEAARILKQHGGNTKIPFHFATWAAEELGLHGSKYYVQKHLMAGTLPMFYVNLDMIANSTNGNRRVNYVVAGGLNYLANVAAQYSEVVPVSALSGGGSDHIPFKTERVPILFFIENDFSEYYHSYQDRLENLEMDYATEVVKGTITAFYYGANALPPIDIREVLNAGNGDDFIITWDFQPDAISYRLDVFDNDSLIQTIETTEDSLYVSGLPINQEICVELYGINADSLGGLRLRKCIELSEVPDPLLVSVDMNMQTVKLIWSNLLPLDAAEVIIERKRDGDEVFELYDEISSGSGSYEILNHETGIWEYQLSLKDKDGFVSDPVNKVVFSVSTKDDIMVVSGQLGGYGNPTHVDVLDFYSNIMPLKDYYLYVAATQSNYLPMMLNMEVVIWNAFSSNHSEFYDNIDLIQSYLGNGGKMILFGKNPQLHFDADHPEGIPFDNDSWVYSMGIGDILDNGGAKLKQILHTSGVSATVDPEKLSDYFNGSLLDFNALVVNNNASVVLTYQSLSESSPINDLDNEPIAIKYENENSSIIICGVPLYYFYEDEAKVLLKKLLEDEMMVGNTEEIVLDNLVKVYPNPIESTLYIKNLSGKPIESWFSIVDISGKCIDQIYVELNNGEVFDIEIDVAPGVYFLSDSQLLINEKIVIK